MLYGRPCMQRGIATVVIYGSILQMHGYDQISHSRAERLLCLLMGAFGTPAPSMVASRQLTAGTGRRNCRAIANEIVATQMLSNRRAGWSFAYGNMNPSPKHCSKLLPHCPTAEGYSRQL